MSGSKWKIFSHAWGNFKHWYIYIGWFAVYKVVWNKICSLKYNVGFLIPLLILTEAAAAALCFCKLQWQRLFVLYLHSLTNGLSAQLRLSDMLQDNRGVQCSHCSSPNLQTHLYWYKLMDGNSVMSVSGFSRLLSSLQTANSAQLSKPWMATWHFGVNLQASDISVASPAKVSRLTLRTDHRSIRTDKRSVRGPGN